MLGLDKRLSFAYTVIPFMLAPVPISHCTHFSFVWKKVEKRRLALNFAQYCKLIWYNCSTATLTTCSFHTLSCHFGILVDQVQRQADVSFNMSIKHSKWAYINIIPPIFFSFFFFKVLGVLGHFALSDYILVNDLKAPSIINVNAIPPIGISRETWATKDFCSCYQSHSCSSVVVFSVLIHVMPNQGND